MSEQEAQSYDVYWQQRGPREGDRCGYAPNLRRWMERNLKGLQGNESILEVGCGNCQFTTDLAKFSSDLHAIDISEWQVNANREQYPDIQFTQHDLSEPLPFVDGSFHALWCSEVIEHLSRPLFALQEFNRVLKPDGLMLLTVPHHGWLKNLFIAAFKWDEHFNPEYPHLQYFTVKMLRKLVEKAGFTSIRTETCGMNKPLRDMIIPTNILLSARK